MALIRKDTVDPWHGGPSYQRQDSYHQHFPAWRQVVTAWKLNHESAHPPWLDFQTFAKWAKEQSNAWAMYPDGPIDFRMKDPEKGWFPGNCYFVWMSYEEREARERNRNSAGRRNRR
jgi:hypothetical protein